MEKKQEKKFWKAFIPSAVIIIVIAAVLIIRAVTGGSNQTADESGASIAESGIEESMQDSGKEESIVEESSAAESSASEESSYSLPEESSKEESVPEEESSIPYFTRKPENPTLEVVGPVYYHFNEARMTGLRITGWFNDDERHYLDNTYFGLPYLEIEGMNFYDTTPGHQYRVTIKIREKEDRPFFDFENIVVTMTDKPAEKDWFKAIPYTDHTYGDLYFGDGMPQLKTSLIGNIRMDVNKGDAEIVNGVDSRVIDKVYIDSSMYYIDPEYLAEGETSEDVLEYEISGLENVDWKKAGTYTITYIVRDKRNGNETRWDREIYIRDWS